MMLVTKMIMINNASTLQQTKIGPALFTKRTSDVHIFFQDDLTRVNFSTFFVFRSLFILTCYHSTWKSLMINWMMPIVPVLATREPEYNDYGKHLTKELFCGILAGTWKLSIMEKDYHFTPSNTCFTDMRRNI